MFNLWSVRVHLGVRFGMEDQRGGFNSLVTLPRNMKADNSKRHISPVSSALSAILAAQATHVRGKNHHFNRRFQYFMLKINLVP